MKRILNIRTVDGKIYKLPLKESDIKESFDPVAHCNDCLSKRYIYTKSIDGNACILIPTKYVTAIGITIENEE